MLCLSTINVQDCTHPGTDNIFYTPDNTITGTSSVTSLKEGASTPGNTIL